jgi:hypothetical protein
VLRGCPFGLFEPIDGLFVANNAHDFLDLSLVVITAVCNPASVASKFSIAEGTAA